MSTELKFIRILDGEHVIGESNRLMSRATVVLAATAVLLYPGTVMGLITATNQWTPHDPAAADGSQNARGILFARAKINIGTQRAVMHVRDCMINGKKLTWKTGIIQADKDAGVAALLARAGAYGNVQVVY